MNTFNYYVPTKALFGCGQLKNLSSQKLPGKKALIVISNGKSTRENGYLAKLEEQLSLADTEYVIFDKIQPNPLKDTVMEGGQYARENKCDFIIALGGGSVMDASKGISVVATNDGDLWDYIKSGTGKGKEIKNTPLPIVAITTTAGTGSETDFGAVITNAHTNEKTGLVDPVLFPKLAIIDPELMKSVPPKFTAYQGFDALFHSVEGYISKKANLMSDMAGSTAIKNIGKYLSRAVKDGNDMEAREHIAFANYLSGIEMCVGSTSSQHSLEHAMSAYHQDLPHGAGLIMLSKAYFSFFIDKHQCDDRFVDMARFLGMETATKPVDFIVTLSKLQKDCGVDDLQMSDYGITPDEFEKMAKNAMDTMGGLFACDRYSLTVEDCVEIYQNAYK